MKTDERGVLNASCLGSEKMAAGLQIVAPNLSPVTIWREGGRQGGREQGTKACIHTHTVLGEKAGRPSGGNQ